MLKSKIHMPETPKKSKRSKQKQYKEGEIALLFNLNRAYSPINNTLKSWLNTTTELDEVDNKIFHRILINAKENIHAWNEEDLKMNFIAHILSLSYFESTKTIRTFFEKTIEAEVEGIYLKIKTDFMIAKGLLDIMVNPYFHFQEYKRETDPNGDPLGQLLEAFLIAQEINKNGKPMYGAYIVGRYWHFVVMEGKDYSVSRAYDSTEHTELLNIIAILKHFIIIMNETLIN
jgi:hypothetical protein